MSGEIPADMCHRAQPDTISDGGIDWLNVKVATADVVRLCEEKGWRPKAMRLPIKELEGEPRENSLPTIPAAEPMAIGAPAGDEAPDGAALPKRKRLHPQIENARRAIKELYPGGDPGQASVRNAFLCRKVGKWIKSAGLPDVSGDTILRAIGRRK